jgi:hypothetical protein
LRQGRVDETKPAADEDPEADAVAKGGDARGPRKGRGNVEDLGIGTEGPMRRWTASPPSPETTKGGDKTTRRR